MRKNERSIKIAFDQATGEILEADIEFSSKKDAFVIRKEFHRDERELYI